MKDISKPALDAVVNGEVNLIPDKFINTYKYWMENVRDWCISRQLWWGQRIPAWYDDKGNFVVAKTEADAMAKFKTLNPKLETRNLRQDEDVVDTWFSSWLWPISVFDGFKDPNNKDINYYYPTNDLVTAPEILFFWVARMMIAGYEYRGKKPFTNVYLTGIVRDKQGRKMSKSLGNSPDPIDLIGKYSADGVRVGMLLCSPAGNDLPFDESYCEQGRNFANKIWNAFRLVKGWEDAVDANLQQSQANKVSVEWFNARFNEQLGIINDLYSKYRISEALMATYKLVWDDFCAWYLEMIKPDFVDGKPMPIDKTTFDATIVFIENILKVLHPFMPFITEEIWHLIKERKEKDCIILAQWPVVAKFDNELVSTFENLKEHITAIRNIRKSKNISPKEKIDLYGKQKPAAKILELDSVTTKLCNIGELKYGVEKAERSISFLSLSTEFYIPITGSIDIGEEKEKLSKELDYNKGFLQSVQKKLANERFVQNAKPELIELERKKQADAEAKIKALEDQLQSLK